MFVWTFIGITDWNGKCFCVCTILTHQVSKSTVAHIFSHSHLCLQCFKEYSKISWHRQSEAVCKIPSCGTTKATFWTHITHDFNKSLKQKSDNVLRKLHFTMYDAAHIVEGGRYPLLPPSQCLFPSSARIFTFWIRTLKKKDVFKYIWIHFKATDQWFGTNSNRAAPNFRRTWCPETKEYRHVWGVSHGTFGRLKIRNDYESLSSTYDRKDVVSHRTRPG